MHITNQILRFDIFTVGNLQYNFMEHDDLINILMSFGTKEILTYAMYFWLFATNITMLLKAVFVVQGHILYTLYHLIECNPDVMQIICTCLSLLWLWVLEMWFLQESGDEEYKGDLSEMEDEVDSDFDIDEGDEPDSEQEEDGPRRKSRVVTKAYKVQESC